MKHPPLGPSLLALAGLVLLLSVPPATAEDGGTPVELGAVAWARDFDAAAGQAKEDGRAVLVLFQEVPG